MAFKESTFGQVRKLDSGRFRADYPDPRNAKGVRKRVAAPRPFTSEQDAHTFLMGVRVDIERGVWVAPDAAVAEAPQVLTVSEYIERWFPWRASKDEPLSPVTEAGYRKLLARFIEPAFGHRDIRSIEPLEVSDWAHRKTPGCPTTRHLAHDAHNFLSVVFKRATIELRLPYNPCVGTGVSKPKPTKAAVILTGGQLAALVKAMPDKYRAPTLLACWGRLRFAEVAGIQRGDISTDGVIRIRRSAVKVAGTKGPTIKAPKTNAGTRVINDLPSPVIAVVLTHLMAHTGPAPTDWLIPAARDARIALANSTYTKALKLAAAEVGLPESFSAHDLRKTGASWDKADGMSEPERLRTMGHTDIELTDRVYTHETPDAFAARMEIREARAAR